VFDEFLAHCAARVSKNDLAASTWTSYRGVLNGLGGRIWVPRDF
jgi:hypothetical protein